MKKQQLLFIVIITALIIGVVMVQKKDKSVSLPEESEMVHKHHEGEKTVPATVSPVAAKVVEEGRVEEDGFSQTMKALPTLADLNDLSSEEVHHTPAVIKEGGLLIGKLHEAAEKEPELREPTLKFFKSCAENEELLPAIRALCWKRTLAQMVEWKIFLEISDAKVSDEIQGLATKIP